MSKSNQATVSVVLAVAVVAAVGTLAYPLFAEDNAHSSDTTAPAHAGAQAVAAARDPDTPKPSSSVAQFLAEHATPVNAAGAAPAAAPATVAPATTAAAPAVQAHAAPPAATPVAAPLSAPVTSAPTLPPPPPPAGAAVANVTPSGETHAQMRLRLRREALAARRAAQEAAGETNNAPVVDHPPANVVMPQKVAEAATAARKPASTAGGWEQVASTPEKPAAAPHRDMSVVVSGDRAWVQVDAKHTVTVKVGDMLPGIGRVMDIHDNKVVTDKGTLTSN